MLIKVNTFIVSGFSFHVGWLTVCGWQFAVCGRMLVEYVTGKVTLLFRQG